MKEIKKRVLLWWYEFTGQIGKWSILYLYGGEDELLKEVKK